MPVQGRAYLETWHYARPFVIARGVLTDAELLVVELTQGAARGRGEACPMPYYGETAEGQRALAAEAIARLAHPDDWPAIHDAMPKSAARNAIDCAVWDLRAKLAGKSVAELIGIPPVQPVVTAYTLGIDRPEVMEARAREASARHSLLKIKLGDWPDDLARIEAIRAAAPRARLIADVNEGWTAAQLAEAMPVLKGCGLELLEQPLRAGQDDALRDIEHLVPVAADESCHVAADIEGIADRYDVINIKLDKSGGLTEAIRMLDRAEALGLGTMVGCMMATSLGIAPGIVVAQRCRFVDLDAPLMLRGDRETPLTYQADALLPPHPALWG